MWSVVERDREIGGEREGEGVRGGEIERGGRESDPNSKLFYN